MLDLNSKKANVNGLLTKEQIIHQLNIFF
uniref:Uncharacterized protein n=1 Tax=Anguilla anguilla TaxID=7936 RepID=A0A0E9S0E3_ANGAN